MEASGIARRGGGGKGLRSCRALSEQGGGEQEREKTQPRIALAVLLALPFVAEEKRERAKKKKGLGKIEMTLRRN